MARILHIQTYMTTQNKIKKIETEAKQARLAHREAERAYYTSRVNNVSDPTLTPCPRLDPYQEGWINGVLMLTSKSVDELRTLKTHMSQPKTYSDPKQQGQLDGMLAVMALID